MTIKIFFAPIEDSPTDLDHQKYLYYQTVHSLRLLFNAKHRTYFTTDKEFINDLPSYSGVISLRDVPNLETFNKMVSGCLLTCFLALELYNDYGLWVQPHYKGWYVIPNKGYYNVFCTDLNLANRYRIDDPRFIRLPTTYEKP